MQDLPFREKITGTLFGFTRKRYCFRLYVKMAWRTCPGETQNHPPSHFTVILPSPTGMSYATSCPSYTVRMLTFMAILDVAYTQMMKHAPSLLARVLLVSLETNSTMAHKALCVIDLLRAQLAGRSSYAIVSFSCVPSGHCGLSYGRGARSVKSQESRRLPSGGTVNHDANPCHVPLRAFMFRKCGVITVSGPHETSYHSGTPTYVSALAYDHFLFLLATRPLAVLCVFRDLSPPRTLFCRACSIRSYIYTVQFSLERYKRQSQRACTCLICTVLCECGSVYVCISWGSRTVRVLVP